MLGAHLRDRLVPIARIGHRLIDGLAPQSGGVEKQVPNGDVVLAVSPELGDVRRDRRVEFQLAIADQTNVPGTILEHPNWTRRLPVDLEDLAGDENIRAIASALAGQWGFVAIAVGASIITAAGVTLRGRAGNADSYRDERIGRAQNRHRASSHCCP